jgi:hypothetical protein
MNNVKFKFSQHAWLIDIFLILISMTVFTKCSLLVKLVLACYCWQLLLSVNALLPTNKPLLPDELAVPPNSKRFALVIAPAGPLSRHQEWLDSARRTGRNWDLALMYYGPNGDQFKCKECVAIYISTCAKWRCLSGFLNSTAWRDILYHRYEAVMVADDDLGMKAGSLNLFFKTFRDYRLILAQPSVCP